MYVCIFHNKHCSRIKSIRMTHRGSDIFISLCIIQLCGCHHGAIPLLNALNKDLSRNVAKAISVDYIVYFILYVVENSISIFNVVFFGENRAFVLDRQASNDLTSTRKQDTENGIN